MDELKLDFLNEWKDLNSFELAGIEILKKGMKIIFENIPKEHIFAAYLKGSFLRREMNKKSDVDVTIIVNDNKYLQTLISLDKKYKQTNELNFEFTGYSIEELKTGKLSELGKKMRSGTARFVRSVSTYQLIYGKELNLNDLKQKTDLEHLGNFINAFYNIFFPAYEKKELGFDDMVKQSLWLFELETSVKNQGFKFKSWNDLLNYFEPNHFIYEVISFRNNNVSNDIKEKFIFDLKEYLKKVESEFF